MMDYREWLKDLHPQTRVWVYIADRDLTNDEVSNLQDALDNFAVRWTSHARRLKARAAVLFDRVIVLAADETQAPASGCSIDASVRFLHAVGDKMGINFFDRMQFGYFDGEKLVVAARDEFERAYQTGAIDENTHVLNPVVDRAETYVDQFIQPLKNSWHKQFV